MPISKHDQMGSAQEEGFMKFTLILMLAGILTACGKSGGNDAASAPAADPRAVTCSTLQGHYYDAYSPANTLDVAGNCTFTDSVCGYSASYTAPDRTTGASVISVTGTNGTPGCMSSTAHMCVIGYNGVQMSIDCDNGAHLYVFTKN